MIFYLVEPINYIIFTVYKEYKATDEKVRRRLQHVYTFFRVINKKRATIK